MNGIEYAKKELELAGFFNKDGAYDGMIGEAVMELITVFFEQGHSGMSANIVRGIFNKLAAYEPLTPLTFNDDEWSNAHTGDSSLQNKRNFAIFKDGKNGRPYYIDAYKMIAVFSDREKSSWGGALDLEDGRSIRKCYIKDPSKIPTIKIELKAHCNSEDPADWDLEPAKYDQLEELKKYYDLEIV